VIVDGKELFSSVTTEWESDFLDIVVELPANSKKLGLLIGNTAGGNAKGTVWVFPRFLLGKPKAISLDNVLLDAPRGNKSKAVGRWAWPWNSAVVLSENGQAAWTSRSDTTAVKEGTWEEKDGKVTITWIKWENKVDVLKYNTAGTKAAVTGSEGTQFNADKMK
jgi:hypothetical protein